jgi:acyl carrier protein
VKADVTSEEEMKEALGQSLERFGRLDGVFFGATVFHETLMGLQEFNRRDCSPELRTRIEGLLTLSRVLEGVDLDFCVLHSSANAVLGGLGYTTYSAVSAFTDAYAAYHARRSGKRWISIGWDRWSHPGEAEASDFTRDLEAAALSSEDGGRTLSRILAMPGLPHVIVSTTDWDAQIARWLHPPERTSSATRESDRGDRAARRAIGTEYVAPETEIESKLAEIIASLLGIDKVGVYDSFFELGGDSLLATRVLSRIRQEYPVELALRQLIAQPTVRDMAERIRSAMDESTAEEPGARPVLRRVSRASVLVRTSEDGAVTVLDDEREKNQGRR